jgi:hypothetical protein
MGTMRVVCQKGDSRIAWNPENKDEVDAARKAFEEYRRKEFAAFRVSPSGKKDGQISAFDPLAEEIIFVPPIAGG